MPVTQAFSANVLPEAFSDKKLRLRVSAIKTKRLLADRDGRAVKKRRNDVPSTPVSRLIEQLCKILGVPVSNSIDNLEDPFM